jgi:3-hydroxyisobutyrate dehydrogenase/2-hydroxy-3-oxopropionate reductase
MNDVAVLGMGAMGSRIARRLLDAGHQVTVWNRNPDRAAPLLKAGATTAATPAEAARTKEAVIVMVANNAALQAVTEGPDGVAAGASDRTTVIEMSTVSPAAVTRLAEQLPDGTHLIDAPVLGSIGEVEAGTLRIFVGGPTTTSPGGRRSCPSSARRCTSGRSVPALPRSSSRTRPSSA